jgi:hypothetical protein
MSPATIEARVMRRLGRYKGVSYLEHFALFMGGVQLLEMHHKGLLAQRYGKALEEMERWTLGRVANEMRAVGVRPDYCALLSSLVTSRNFIAHEMLASYAMLKSLVKGWSPRLGRRVLDPATYELERLVVLASWCDKYDGWGAA